MNQNNKANFIRSRSSKILSLLLQYNNMDLP